MNFKIISLFPDSFSSYLNESILKRAILKKLIKVSFFNPRDFSIDKHHKVDDRPYGGGPGMILYALPIIKAIKKSLPRTNKKKTKVIIFSPSGKEFTNDDAKKNANSFSDIVFVCGRYEGIDSRVYQILKKDSFFKDKISVEHISIGKYVLAGGELPALVLIESISRQIKGVLGDNESLEENRVSSSEMYTRPGVLSFNKKEYKVPKVLLSGDHKKIEQWKISKNNK